MASGALAKLTVNLGLSVTEFSEGLNKAQTELAEFASKAATAVGVAAAAVTGLVTGAAVELVSQVRDTINRLDELNKNSAKAGLDPESFQGLEYAAKLADVSVGSLTSGINKFNIKLVEANTGNKQAAAVFRGLGIDIKEAIERPGPAFEQFIDRLGEIDNSAVRAAVAQKVLGRGFQEFAQLIQGGGLAIREAKEELEAFGAKASNEVVEQADQLRENIVRLTVAKLGLKNTIAEGLLPVLNALARVFIETKKGSSELRDAMKELSSSQNIVNWLEQIVLGGAAVVDAFYEIGRSVKNLVSLFEALGKLFSSVADAAVNTAQAIGNAYKFNFEAADAAAQRGRESVLGIKSAAVEVGAAIKQMFAPPETPAREFVARFFERVRDELDKGGRAARTHGDLSGNVLAALTKPEKIVAEKIDPFDTELRGLQREAAQLEFNITNFERFHGAAHTAKLAAVEFDIAVGKLSDTERLKQGFEPLTAEQQRRILQAAEDVKFLGKELQDTKTISSIRERIKAIDLETEAIGKTNTEREIALKIQEFQRTGIDTRTDAFKKERDNLIESITRQNKAREELQTQGFAQSERDNVDAINLEITALTLNATEVKKLTDARRIDIAARNLTRNPDGSLKVQQGTAAAVEAEAAKAKQNLDTAIDARRTAERDALTGAKAFFAKYGEEATNAAANTQQFLQASFGALATELDKLLTTGKFGVRSFVDAINSEFRRIAIKEFIGGIQLAISGLLKSVTGVQGTSGTTGLTGALLGAIGSAITGSAIGGVFGGGVSAATEGGAVGSFSTSDSLIRAQAESFSLRAVPVTSGGNGFVYNDNSVNQFDARSDTATIGMLLAQNKEATKRDILSSQRRRGDFDQRQG